MAEVDEDFFMSGALIKDPYPYYEALRSQCPVQREPNHDVVMITGYDEALEVYRDIDNYSSCIAVTGPFPGFPVPLDGDDVGDDIGDLIEQYRDQLPYNDQLPSFDPPHHTQQRGLLMRLLSPRRLKENEDAMWALADRQLDTYFATEDRDFIRDYAGPFALLVIADLLGVPDEERAAFQRHLNETKGFGSTAGESLEKSPLEFLYETFSEYIEDRRQSPRDDVLTQLAQATFKDGSTPPVIDVARLAANLFAAGQETTVRMLAAAVLMLAEDPDLQQSLRDDRDLIPNFIEEVLRFESPVKGDFRLSKVPVTVGGVDLPAGTTFMLLNGAINRDPDQFEDPAEFRPTRANAREHLAFGHGAHFCPGAPLARAEGRISLERILDRMSNIRVSDERHGPAGERKFRYHPTYLLRGLTRLYIEFDEVPVG